MNINLRRGLFRVWVVLTVLWVALSVAVVRPDQAVSSLWDFRSASDDKLTHIVAEAIQLERDKIPPPPEGFHLDLSKSEIENSRRILSNMNKMRDQFAPETDVMSYLQSENLGTKSTEKVLLATEAMRRKSISFETLKNYSLAAFIPPLIILVVSLMLQWAISGFIRQPSTPPNQGA